MINKPDTRKSRGVKLIKPTTGPEVKKEAHKPKNDLSRSPVSSQTKYNQIVKRRKYCSKLQQSLSLATGNMASQVSARSKDTPNRFMVDTEASRLKSYGLSNTRS